MTAARKLKPPQPRRRSEEIDVVCTECGPYKDLIDQHGALTIEHGPRGKPTNVWFDPWDTEIPSADLTPSRYLRTAHQLRLTCDEGHDWRFEIVEDDLTVGDD